MQSNLQMQGFKYVVGKKSSGFKHPDDFEDGDIIHDESSDDVFLKALIAAHGFHYMLPNFNRVNCA